MDAFIANTYSAINSGFLFIPFAIGISLIYRNLKQIDVSIDGVVIIAGIVSAIAWNVTQSYVVSMLAGTLTGMLCSVFVAGLQAYFSVPSLMSGLIFSLIAHTVSIFWIGESVNLKDTEIIRVLNEDSIVIPPWHLTILVLCYIVPIYFYNSHMGLSIRKLGNSNTANLYYSEPELRFSAYALTGSIYGVGAAIYVHSRGSASAGATFEFLVYALTAYLLVSKFFPQLASAFNKFRDKLKPNLIPKGYEFIKDWVAMIVSHEALMAPVGAVLLEVITTHLIDLATLSKTTQIWKLALSITLLVVLASWPTVRRALKGDEPIAKELSGVSIADVDFSYEFAGETRVIFSNTDVDFASGLNILLGSNGSGKTTLLKLISGELMPDEGLIYRSGKNITFTPSHQRSVYILMQNPLHTLVPEMTVQENLFLAWERSSSFTVNGKSSSLRRMQSHIKKSGLDLIDEPDSPLWTRPVKSLSGGQAYCIAIYAAVLSGKEVILADEPTTGLDKNNYGMVRDALIHLTDNKSRTVIIVTHDDRLKDITWNKYYIRDRSIQSESYWWDARYAETFFSSVYRIGDDSKTGYLNGMELDLYERTKREIDLIVGLIGDVIDKKILDCPSGYGRHAIELGRRGASVWGVDISPSFIRESREHAAIDLPSCKRPMFLEGDMRNLPDSIENDFFDCCLNMFFAFGFFNDDENQKTLEEYYRVLVTGGKLIIHTDVNPDLIVSGEYGDPKSRELQNGMFLKIDEAYNKKTRRLDGTWTIFDGDNVFKSQRYSVRIYEHAELDGMLKKAGFKRVAIDYPDPASKQEVIYIATK